MTDKVVNEVTSVEKEVKAKTATPKAAKATEETTAAKMSQAKKTTAKKAEATEKAVETQATAKKSAVKKAPAEKVEATEKPVEAETAVVKKVPAKKAGTAEPVAKKTVAKAKKEQVKQPLIIDGRYIVETKKPLYNCYKTKGEKPYEISAKQIKVTLIRGTNGSLEIHKKTVAALGLTKIGSSNTLSDSKALQGMIYRVRHLVKVDELGGK